MIFNSFSFLVFYPIVTVVYFIIPYRVRYLWLLAASYYFYMSWNPKYALLIAASTIITYFSGLLIGRENNLYDKFSTQDTSPAENISQRKKKQLKRCQNRKKLWLALSFISNLAILFFFKYFDFAINNLNAVLGKLGMELVQPTFDVLLPVGISFYTFQALSYSMDIYRGEIYVEKNLAKYALFVSYFPQMVAGPIERSKNLLIQLSTRHYFDYERMKLGLSIILWGLFLKIVVADRVAILVDQVYGDYTSYIGLQLVIATLFFGIQIYCDFASYSLIALGTAKVMGFNLTQNFKEPYFARSITEFWHRWHISLSTWFRDYLYIPLGGNRKGNARKYLNIMIVFLVSGLWHGASWNFVIWGFLHGAFQVIGQATKPIKANITDKLGIDRKKISYQLGQIFINYCMLNFAWIFFRAPDLATSLGIIQGIFAQWNPWIFIDGTLFELGLNQQNFVVAILSIFVLLCVSIISRIGYNPFNELNHQGIIFRWLIYFALIIAIIVFGIYGPGYSETQFIYFQF
jgi:alginate O-acetyltransferase complex protein AlgI